MRSLFLVGLILLPALFLSAGCFGSSPPAAAAPGPIDGTYKDTSTAAKCNGTAEGTGSLPSTIVLSGATYSYTTVANATDGCIVTFTGGVTYPGTSGITITQTTKSCGASCSGADCTANSTTEPTNIGTYALSGTTLTITFTNSTCSCTSNCTGSAGGTDTEINAGYVKQ